MARIRTKPRKKAERPSGGLIGCIFLVLIAIAFVTWVFYAVLNQ